MFKSNLTNYTVLAFGAASLLTGLCTYYYRNKKKRDKIPTEWKLLGKVTNLYIYPLKSGHRMELSEAQCNDYGMSQTYEDSKILQLRDRCLVVYREDVNEFRTARTYPRLVLIDVTVHDENHVALNAPGMRELFVKLPLDGKGKIIDIKVWNELMQSIDCGDEAATWLSRYILDEDKGLRLGYNIATSVYRNLDKAYPELSAKFPLIKDKAGGLYTDLTSYMLMNKSSIDDLNGKLDQKVSERNFRPNILIDGDNIPPYDEDKWDWMKIGDVVFRHVKPCTRCHLTTINPENGVRDKGEEPLKTLKKYRLFKEIDDKSPVLGANLALKMGGSIHVNDEIYIGQN